MRGGVFICHASSDAGVAQRAVAALEAAGVPCWIAPRDIDPGENYTQAILESLEAAPAIVLMFSSTTNESPHVARELEIAVGSGRPIVPVRLEAVEPSRSLRYFIGTSQWLEAHGGSGDQWTPALVRAARRAVGDSTDTVIRPAPVPAAAPHPAVDRAVPAPSLPPPPSPRRWGRGAAALAGAGLVVVVVVAVVVLSQMGGTGGADDSAQGPGETGAVAKSQSPDASTTLSDSPSATEESPSGPVTCWNGKPSVDAAHCPAPAGRAGMATVFPGLTAACTPVDSPVEGKAEVYECEHDGFLVRYTRWDKGYDKESYYSVENRVAAEDWPIDGELSGLQWWSMDDDPAETQPYQWSAAYAGRPFSISVEGDTNADRSAGVAGLQLVPVSQIGLE
jgi:hypothetical protein